MLPFIYWRKKNDDSTNSVSAHLSCQLRQLFYSHSSYTHDLGIIIVATESIVLKSLRLLCISPSSL